MPELVLGLMIVAEHYRKADTAMVITSVNDSGRVHRFASLHAVGAAADIRTKSLPLDRAGKIHFVQQITYDLGENYDCILEGVGTPNEHLHIEYQPHRAAL